MPATLDIVLPCYNPPKNWAEEIVSNFIKLSQLLPSVSIKIILVNDGSTKNITAHEIDYLMNELPAFQYISYIENKGKGYALRKGIAESYAIHCIYSDIDFPYTTNSIIDIYSSLQNNQDVIVGNRGGDYYDGVPPIRIFISKLLRLFNRVFLGMKIYDTQCGLKGFNEKGKAIFLNTIINRYLFDLEFVYLCSNSKETTINPVNVTLKEGVVFSKMNINILKQEGWSFLKLVFRHFKKKIF